MEEIHFTESKEMAVPIDEAATFIPSIWDPELLKAFTQSIVIRDRNPKTVTVPLPRDPVWLAARDAFLARWNALTDEGAAAGYIEDTYEGWVPASDQTYGTIANPDYDASREGETVTFQVTVDPHTPSGVVIVSNNT